MTDALPGHPVDPFEEKCAAARAERAEQVAAHQAWQDAHYGFVRHLIATGRLTDMIERED